MEKIAQQNRSFGREITAIYFSPTNSTKRVVEAVAGKLSSLSEIPLREISLTLPSERLASIGKFGGSDILVLGLPVYAGRIPQIVDNTLRGLNSDGAQAIIIAVYGNRDYDDALIEMSDILSERGFKIVAAGAFIGEHSFSREVGKGRPDGSDIKIAEDFASSIAKKIAEPSKGALKIKGNRPYKQRLPMPPSAPKTLDACTNCGLCAKICPAGAIDKNNPKKISDGCLMCCACVKACPQNAKYFDSEIYLKFKAFLEENYSARKEPELFY